MSWLVIRALVVPAAAAAVAALAVMQGPVGDIVQGVLGRACGQVVGVAAPALEQSGSSSKRLVIQP